MSDPCLNNRNTFLILSFISIARTIKDQALDPVPVFWLYLRILTILSILVKCLLRALGGLAVQASIRVTSRLPKRSSNRLVSSLSNLGSRAWIEMKNPSVVTRSNPACLNSGW